MKRMFPGHKTGGGRRQGGACAKACESDAVKMVRKLDAMPLAAVERVAECIAAIRELATCTHPDDKTVAVGSGEGEMWCRHCGAFFGYAPGDEFERSEIGKWARSVQR